MKISSTGKVLSRVEARNYCLINQLATPGLGSLMARRYVPAAGQLLLAVAGFVLIVMWFVAVMHQLYRKINGSDSDVSVAWLGECGAAVFLLGWVWALFTSMSLLREAQGNEPPLIQPP